jgi:uncharacterized repeat protein (TIGR02543 family)
VAASPVAGGTVTGGGAHTVGASVTVTAAANSGYTFTNWTENGDVVSASASYSFNMPADSLSLTANFTITTTTGGGGGGAPAVYTPTVQTEAASSVTTGSAALNGDITSSGNGNITEYGFLWGTSSSNLNNTLQVGTDNRSGAFTASLGSLTASTTYYFEAYATNSYGTADGAVLNFTIIAATPPLVPAPIFSDVPASFWAYSDIANLSGLGYVSGYPDGAFQPNSQITRAEVAAIMDKVLNLAPYTPQSPTFTDVTRTAGSTRQWRRPTMPGLKLVTTTAPSIPMPRSPGRRSPASWCRRWAKLSWPTPTLRL